MKKLIKIVIMMVWLLALLNLTPFIAEAQVGSGWATPVNLGAGKMDSAWFPEIATDGQGRAYITYLRNEGRTGLNITPSSEIYDRVYLQPVGSDGAVAGRGPFDIALSPAGSVPYAKIAVDNNRGLLHLVYRSKKSIYYQYAPLDKANLPQAWSQPRNLDDFGDSSYSDIAVDARGTIHVVWTQEQGDSLENLKQTVVYRQSSDLGKTWSFPKTVAPPRYSATHVTLRIDQGSRLHVAWDDGFDNLTNRFQPALSYYTYSDDNGATWAKPVFFGDIQDPISQMVMTTFGAKGVMLVWRNIGKNSLEYTVSNDGGVTWAKPATLSRIAIVSYAGALQGETYSLVSDGFGKVHLAAAGLLNPLGINQTDNRAILHLVWSNGEWSQPETIGSANSYVESPRLAFGPDRLYAVWFSRDLLVNDTTRQVWYSSRPYDTGIKPQPVGSFITNATPTPAVQAAQVAAPTAIPVLPPLEAAPPAVWLSDGYRAVLLGLVPVGLVGIGIIGLVFWRVRAKKRG